MEKVFELEKEHYRIWRAIGTELSVDVDTLSAIEKDHADDKDRLHAVIDNANPAPTREAMTKILQSANINIAIAGMVLSLPSAGPSSPLPTTTKGCQWDGARMVVTVNMAYCNIARQSNSLSFSIPRINGTFLVLLMQTFL